MEARAEARSVPMSIVDGSTSPSHEEEEEVVVGQIGHSVFSHPVVEVVAVVVLAGV